MRSAASVQTRPVSEDDESGAVSLGALFRMFLKAGLAFGGGPGVMATLQHELVEKRHGLTRSEYLTLFALGRIAPCGNMMAMAVACGYRFHGILGTLVSLGAMILPSFAITVILAALYQSLNGTPVMGLVSATLLPAALGLICVQALRMSQDVFKPCVELALAVACFVGATVFGISPPLLLLISGLIGVIAIRDREAKP